MTDTKITPDEHSDVVGGSTAGRVLACPGSVQLNQAVKRAHKQRILDSMNLASKCTLDDMPPVVAEVVEDKYRAETTSEYANEGTGLHEAVAWILENDEEPESVVDRTFEGILITPTLYSEAIVPALDSFDAYCELVYEEDGEDMEFLVERRCQLPGIPNAFGTSDIVGKTSKRVVIWDWKFGAGVAVSPWENNQLRFYARAALHTEIEWFGFADDVPPDTRVDLIISQPRIGDGEYQLWATDFKDLEVFRWHLARAVDEAVEDNARVSVGEHCRWCEAKHVCPAKQQLGQRILGTLDDVAADVAETEVGEDAFDMPIPALLKASEVQFTPDDLADWLRDADDIADWVKWVRSLAMEELQAGRAVTGKELDQSLSNASWSVDDKTVDRRLASYGLSVDERRAVKAISPTQARKLVKAKGDEKKQTLLEKIIQRLPGGVKMVDEGKAKTPVKCVGDSMADVGAKLNKAVSES